eukprot:TRINITY_DN228_c0_g1_i2.p2 TRINITY_DN228_c0_g1~~TRINITY_DN228_c0_g1_i2.p2  ORF type:complete len:227 (-),score=45.10 TRINITY_DN228_c0_g1_i2:671-1351(-)
MGSVKNMRVVAAVALRALPVGGPSIASAPPPAPLAAAGPSDAASASAVSSADNDVNPPALQRLTTPPPPPPAAAAAAAAAAKSWQSAAPLPTAQNRSTHADASIGTLHGTDHDGSLPPALLAAPASNDATDPLMNLPLMPFLPEASPASPAAGAAAATSSRNVLEVSQADDHVPLIKQPSSLHFLVHRNVWYARLMPCTVYQLMWSAHRAFWVALVRFTSFHVMIM